jgi:hypothetical protein
MISSVGVGGSSWLIKAMLTFIGVQAVFENYERGELRECNDTVVTFVIIRPYAHTDKPAKGQYKVIHGNKAHLAKPIPRPDSAKFFLYCAEGTLWDAHCVSIGGL